jgi:hypothetical protein
LFFLENTCHTPSILPPSQPKQHENLSGLLVLASPCFKLCSHTVARVIFRTISLQMPVPA